MVGHAVHNAQHFCACAIGQTASDLFNKEKLNERSIDKNWAVHQMAIYSLLIGRRPVNSPSQPVDGDADGVNVTHQSHLTRIQVDGEHFGSVGYNVDDVVHPRHTSYVHGLSRRILQPQHNYSVKHIQIDYWVRVIKPQMNNSLQIRQRPYFQVDGYWIGSRVEHRIITVKLNR